MNKSDQQLKHDVEEELRWDPRVNAMRIAVGVEQGKVSLIGSVDSYAEKSEAEDVTKRVAGVRSVDQDLIVDILVVHEHSDSEIASAARSALTWDVWVPKTVTVDVRSGQLALRGEVAWQYQRDAAERAVHYLTGIVGVDNHIVIRSTASVLEVNESAPGVTAVIDRAT